jgi:hypothetical protein
MKRKFKEVYAVALLLLALFSGMLMTAITSGHDGAGAEPVVPIESIH